MEPLLVALDEEDPLASPLAAALGAERAQMNRRSFPDGESYLRYDSSPAGRSVILLCSLDRPDSKFLPLAFAAATARELGATSVGLVAPYLAYMRQDRRFQPGEAVTSTCFAGLVSREVDWLVTVDPHLHRHHSLAEIYSVPAVTLHAAPLLAAWIRDNVERPLLIGPDSESAQWVSAVAGAAPHVVLEKVRHGDRDVEISIPHVERWSGYTPVLVDDIVSSGRTLIETLGHLRRAGLAPAVCVAVHGIFAGAAYRELLAAGASRVVTTNTLCHESNEIDVVPLLAEGVRRLDAG
ncbi:ribose-phosphate pyrophosphokinase [Pelagibius sp. CAU 1746]|uniref:ribose-phosphate pyrophosphokinase n=1 Tax=Pelagibius sp. CAU 1746 TaxID=3140370 RepID=UPI00325B980C